MIVFLVFYYTIFGAAYGARTAEAMVGKYGLNIGTAIILGSVQGLLWPLLLPLMFLLVRPDDE